jgi:hypothetical protein
LKASNTEAGDHFGVSVALSPSFVVVGADGEASNATGMDGDQSNNSVPGAGAAYEFERVGNVWSSGFYLKASDTGLTHSFGYSVAVSELANFNGIIVGAFPHDDPLTEAGAAYLFVPPTPTPTVTPAPTPGPHYASYPVAGGVIDCGFAKDEARFNPNDTTLGGNRDLYIANEGNRDLTIYGIRVPEQSYNLIEPVGVATRPYSFAAFYFAANEGGAKVTSFPYILAPGHRLLVTVL